MSKKGGEKEKATTNEAYTENLIDDESEVDETFTVLQFNQRRVNGESYSRENIIHFKVDRVENGQFQNESSETNGDASKNVLPNVEIDNHPNPVSKISMEKIKGSTEESSFEERRDELNTRDRSFYEEYPSNQTLTDIDSMPIHFVADSNKKKKQCDLQKGNKIPNKIHTCQYPKKRVCEKEACLVENCDTDFTKHNICQHGTLNRYNNSHVQIYQTRHSKRPWFFPFLSKKKKYKLKNMSKGRRPYSTSDSGETVPQLYKAKMIADLSSIPKMFKFRAVTGNSGLPFKMTSRNKIPQTSDKKCCFINEVHQCDDGKNNMNGYHCKKCNSMKAHEYIPKQLFSEKTDGLMTFPKRLYDSSNVRACLNLDGMEYISTNELPQRIDVYCFDHLNTSYFRTTDQPPPLLTDEAIQRTEDVATRFWAEIFGFCHLFISFLTAFILQLYKFFLFSFIRPLLSGLVQLTSDYLLKPLLTISYNGFLQPVMVFAFNVATSFRDVCQPLARGLGFFLSEIAVLLRAIRLAEWNKTVRRPPLKDSYC